MAIKVPTVKKIQKTREITHYHVYVGGHPARTFDDESLAQHYAAEEKAALVRRGCDVNSTEFSVWVEAETKEQTYEEVQPVVQAVVVSEGGEQK